MNKFYINRSQFQTQKELDGNNFLIAYDVPIAKTGIQQYTREEIGDKNGPPNELVNVYRDESVFNDPKLVESFDGIPIVYEHPGNGKVDHHNFKNFIVGTVSGVYYKDGDLFAKKLTIIDKEAIENVLRKNTNELSIGFRGNVTRESGVFNGEKYEFKENVIHANHLALCENGKAGSYYAINSKKKGTHKMNFVNESDGESGKLDKNIEGLIEQAVKKKLAQVRPKNFGNEDMENEEEESSSEEKKEMKKDAKKMKNESDPELEKADDEDKDVVNALKKHNRTLKDLVADKNGKIRDLELANAKLDEALTEAKEYMRDMSNHIKTRNLSHALSGPDSLLNPSHPRQVDMANSLTSSFLMK